MNAIFCYLHRLYCYALVSSSYPHVSVCHLSNCFAGLLSHTSHTVWLESRQLSYSPLAVAATIQELIASSKLKTGVPIQSRTGTQIYTSNPSLCLKEGESTQNSRQMKWNSQTTQLSQTSWGWSCKASQEAYLLCQLAWAPMSSYQ